MSSAKIAAACALAAVSLSGCGVAAKPVAGSAVAVTSAKQSKADPRTKHIKCLAADHIGYSLFMKGPYPSIQVGHAPSGPTVVFYATPGIAQGIQIAGKSQGAEVIGAALVYPNAASDKLMNKVETCMALGVSG